MDIINTIGFYMALGVAGVIGSILFIFFIVEAWQESPLLGILLTIAFIGLLLAAI